VARTDFTEQSLPSAPEVVSERKFMSAITRSTSCVSSSASPARRIRSQRADVVKVEHHPQCFATAGLSSIDQDRGISAY
jgi:hypothetical protein